MSDPTSATSDPETTFDVVVLGAGSTGEHAADVVVRGGLSAALFADGYEGTAIAVVDPEREVLLGITFVGPAVAELLHAAAIAVVGEVPISRLWHAVPASPTVSEVWLRLLETWRG